MVLLGWHSDRTKDRAYHGLFGATWYLIGFILLRALPPTSGRGARYVGALVAGSWPQTHSLNIGWMTENTGSVAKRTVASGLIIGAANIYALWSSQVSTVVGGLENELTGDRSIAVPTLLYSTLEMTSILHSAQ
jgi:hypothetical protein